MDRLGEVLGKCSRDELLQLAATVHQKVEPAPEWAASSEADLGLLVARELRYQGSSSVAFLWRKVRQGGDQAGVPYEQILDDLIGTTNLNPRVVARLGEQLADHVYAKEILFTMLFSPGAEGGAGGGISKVLQSGLAALRGPGAYAVIAQATTSALKAAGKGLPAVKVASGILGPVATALAALDVGRAVLAMQGPNLGVCAMAVALVGSLRLKYFPLPDEKLRGLETFVASLDRECRECGRRIEKPEGSCVLCWVALHRECGSPMKRLDTDEEGRVCTDCRRKDLDQGGMLVPLAGGLSPAAWVDALGYRAQVLNNRLDRSAKDIERALLGVVENVQSLRKETISDLEKMLRKAFGYIYVMFFTTVFLSLLGIAYFQSAKSRPDATFNPGVFFRFSLLITIVLPLLIWFAGALRRATVNRRREDYEKSADGRRLSLKDYLFGFLYYDHPIENIWGPIALIGMTVAGVMWVLFF